MMVWNCAVHFSFHWLSYLTQCTAGPTAVSQTQSHRSPCKQYWLYCCQL